MIDELIALLPFTNSRSKYEVLAFLGEKERLKTAFRKRDAMIEVPNGFPDERLQDLWTDANRVTLLEKGYSYDESTGIINLKNTLLFIAWELELEDGPT